jgi:hypothetical protein
MSEDALAAYSESVLDGILVASFVELGLDGTYLFHLFHTTLLNCAQVSIRLSLFSP